MNVPLLPGRIEHWPLARLKPYARNAKTHDADQVAKIAASMTEFGWTVPVLVAADGELIAGHGRILAAAHLGLSESPGIILGHLTEAQRRAYRIADNKLTELDGWDEALLLQELQALLAEDFDLGRSGSPRKNWTLCWRMPTTAPRFPTMPPTPSPNRLLSRSPSRAISGRWANTGCAAAMPPIRPLSSG